MFYWSIIFFIIAIIAGIFGFGGISTTALGFAKTLFFIALILAIIMALFGFFRRP